MSAAVSRIREPLIEGHKNYHQITEDLIGPTEKAPNTMWIVAFTLVSDNPRLWGFSRFVGPSISASGLGTQTVPLVGHTISPTSFGGLVSATQVRLISAILLLFRQRWRTGVNRAAEAMTIFAVMCAGIFPATHTGRPWFDFFMFPYPNTRGPLWVNFNSPLLWDSVRYLNLFHRIACLFWYTGLGT
jgi:hypothetical protein